MKKNWLNPDRASILFRLKKTVRIMKTSVFLLFVSILSVSAENSYSQNTRLSMEMKEATVEEVLSSIENQSEFYFLYSNKLVDVNRKVSFRVKNNRISTILDHLFADTDIGYVVQGRQIILSPNDMLTGQDPLSPQQGPEISGRVTDQEGASLPGATIAVKGTSTGTVTGVDGNYSIEVENTDVTLVFSFIGYLPKEVVVGNQTIINITLIEDIAELEEVVVIGYGVQKKSVVTGAISSVKAEELVMRPVASPEQALQGKVSGVVITQNTGAPGSAMTVRIRGVGTSGYNEPLYIVDGVQMGNLSSINPADIESVEILKDAASGAIYGARAANGVVLVTTKKGKAGKMTVSYNGYYGVQTPWKKLDVPDAYEYMMLRNEGYTNDGLSPKYSEEEIINNIYDTNWQDEVFSQSAPITNHHIQVSGGNDYSKFNMSAGYFNQKGIVGGDKASYDKYSFRVNSDHKINDHIRIGENFSYYTSGQSGIANQHYIIGVLSTALSTEPNIPIHMTDPETVAYYDALPTTPVVDASNGLYYTIPEFGRNPLAWLETTYNHGTDNALSGNFYLEIVDIVDGLKFRSDVGIYRGNGYGRGFSPEAFFHAADITPKSNVSQSFSEAFTIQWENTLSYTRSINNHNITGLLGTSLNKGSGSYMSGVRTDIFPVGWHYAWLNNGANDPSQHADGAYWESKLLSYFGRVDYNYSEKYMFTATIRADGSSKFGPENKFGYFPSAAAGWIISKESFFPGKEVINHFKIRASWGQVGNDAIGSFGYLSTMGNGYSFLVGPGTLAQSIVPGAAANPALQWETSEQTNFGLDLHLLNSKILFNVEYYMKNTKNLLAIEPIPMYVGLSSPLSNVGEISNKGLEFKITARSAEHDFHYEANVIASYNKNKVIKVGNEEGYINGGYIAKELSGSLRMEEGMDFPFFYGYKTDGIFQNLDEINNYTNSEGEEMQPEAKPGDIRYVDTDGSGSIDENDRTHIGQAMPDWTFALNFSADYKNFDLSFMFQGQQGNYIANMAFSPGVYDRWHGENTSDTWPRMTTTDLNRNRSRMNDMVHIEDGSFIRLKNLQLGYTIPARISQRAGISNLRIYVSGQNLLTFTNYGGFDPEIGTGNTGRFLDFGIDRAAYPQSRVFTTGISVTF